MPKDTKNKFQQKPQWLKQAERSVIVNEDDEDLKPIELFLPEPPPVETIDGFDKSPAHQYFRRPEVPVKLLALQKRCKTAEECINELRREPVFYADEIKFIQTEWERRRNGYWFFNNGRPTYIPGVHYFYLCYWFLNGKRPDYRSRDRKFFLFAMMCLQDPYCAGFNYPKFRREGATSKSACFEYWLITMERNVHAGNQSKDKKSSDEIFTVHLVPNHRRMPFWFRPVYSGKTDPKASLDFFAPATVVSKDGAEMQGRDALESFIDYGSSTEGIYDGAKLRIHYGDEVGKTKEANVYKRHLIVKPSITDGNRYVGMIINTTTVGEMTKDGGANFQRLAKGSMYHERKENGETVTGLYNLFIPVYDGFNLEDKKTKRTFIDKYGECDKEAVKKYLSDNRKALLDSGDLEAYNEEVRQYPMSYKECFRVASGICKFDEQILEDVLDKFRFHNPYKVRGNFMWKDNIQDTEVVWVPSENGRWLVSYIPEHIKNRYIMIDGKRTPANKHLFIGGADPFKFKTTKGSESEVSKGGGAIFRKYDPSIDPPDADVSTWQSNKFCCTYLFRPRNNDLFDEDMLMMSVFYGCQMLPEINIPHTWEWFDKRGYEEYLYYKTDIRTGKKTKTPGSYTNTTMQETIFGEFQYYISMYGKYEVHDEIFRQCRDIQDDMNPFDLFVAAGHALLGARREEKMPETNTTTLPYHRKFKYPKR